MERVEPTQALLECKPAPVFPGEPGEPATEIQFLVYMARLEAVHDECYDNAAELRRLFPPPP